MAYNGWTNYETWIAALWLSETDFTGRLESGDLIRVDAETTIEDIETVVVCEIELLTEVNNAGGLALEFIRSGISEIDTREIAEGEHAVLMTKRKD